MRYKILLFDLDGVVTDSQLGVTKSVSYALSSLGITPPELPELRKFIGPPLQDSFRNFYQMDDEDCALAITKYREYYTTTGIFENKLFPKVAETLAKLKDRAYSIALATSKPEKYATQILKYFSVDKLFDQVVGASLDGSLIAKSDIIKRAIQRFPESRNCDFVMIGDRKHDMIGAKDNDIDAIGALWGYGGKEELALYCPKFLTEQFSDLLEILCPANIS